LTYNTGHFKAILSRQSITHSNQEKPTHNISQLQPFFLSPFSLLPMFSCKNCSYY